MRISIKENVIVLNKAKEILGSENDLVKIYEKYIVNLKQIKNKYKYNLIGCLSFALFNIFLINIINNKSFQLFGFITVVLSLMAVEFINDYHYNKDKENKNLENELLECLNDKIVLQDLIKKSKLEKNEYYFLVEKIQYSNSHDIFDYFDEFINEVIENEDKYEDVEVNNMIDSLKENNVVEQKNVKEKVMNVI